MPITNIIIIFCSLLITINKEVDKTSFKFQLVEGNLTENQNSSIKRILIGNFYISKKDISNTQYVFFLNAKVKKSNFINTKRFVKIDNMPCQIIVFNGIFKVKKGYGNKAANQITYHGGLEFCKWLSENREVLSFNIPTKYHGDFRVLTKAEFNHFRRSVSQKKNKLLDDKIYYFSDKSNKIDFKNNYKLRVVMTFLGKSSGISF